MLLWMIYNGEIAPFFNQGRSIAKATAFSILFHALGSNWNSANRDNLIREQFEPEFAGKLIAARDTDQIEEVALEFDDDPTEVAAGYFVFATTIDWDKGIVESEVDHKSANDDHLFWDSEYFLASDFENPSFSVTLSGLCFERERIEMLQPSAELAPVVPRQAGAHSRVGRPRTWDWDAATMHLLTIAQMPDGLPTGPGAQAQIERLIAEWFMTAAGNAPSESQVRQHATKIVRALDARKGR
jgi:hypothetical protein